MDGPKDHLESYIEPFKDWGAPGTVHMPVTGHVLSLPAQDEGLPSYAWRVSDQAHCGEESGEGQVSARNKIGLGYGLNTLPTRMPTGGPQDWPLAVDAFFNPNAYKTELEAKPMPEQLYYENLPSDFNTPQKQQKWQEAHPGQMYYHDPDYRG